MLDSLKELGLDPELCSIQTEMLTGFAKLTLAKPKQLRTWIRLNCFHWRRRQILDVQVVIRFSWIEPKMRKDFFIRVLKLTGGRGFLMPLLYRIWHQKVIGSSCKNKGLSSPQIRPRFFCCGEINPLRTGTKPDESAISLSLFAPDALDFLV